MKKKIIAWTVGSALFAGIVGFWAYSLPDILKYYVSGRSDSGLKEIVDTVNGKDGGMSADLLKLQSDLDKGLGDLKSGIRAGETKAQAITDLKEKLLEKTNANLNANANIPAGAPAATNKNSNAPQR